ncbi:MAG: arylsulfatase [Planctomycetota bacterium]
MLLRTIRICWLLMLSACSHAPHEVIPEATAAPAHSSSRPNIVYILADDWGYGDISALNPDSKISTPYTDAFIEQGMLFTGAHSTSAVCTPSRYSILTGRYCWRGPLKRSVLGGYDKLLIEDGRMTVASLLRDAGYQTACIGKWHLGLGWNFEKEPPKRPTGFYVWEDTDTVIDYQAPVATGPHTVGFGYSFIMPASLDMIPYCYIGNGEVLDHPFRRVEASPRPAEWREGPAGRGFDHETTLLEFTLRAEAYLAGYAKTSREKPFFLYFPMTSPHTPHVPRPPFRGASDAGEYGDFVVEHDWSIGRVLDALDRHGLAENTIVIITSDNGGHGSNAYALTDQADQFDFETEYGHRSNHVFRGQKTDAWEGGHRVPHIVRWPGVVEPGSRSDATITLADLLATAAELVEQALPNDAGEDSVSLVPLLRGQDAHAHREAIITHSWRGVFAIQQGPWKLIDARGGGGWTEPEPEDGPLRQLYHLGSDVEESNNVYGQHPEVESRLLELLDRYRRDGRSVTR